MTHLRHNEVTGRWIAVAPRRGGRPIDYQKAPAPLPPSHVQTCPFCPGQEDQLPGVLAEAPSPVPGAPWGCRVVPNLFPAFTAESDPRLDSEPGGLAARGLQEVLIESPYHDRDPSRLSEAELTLLLSTIQARLGEAAVRCPGGWPFVFKNHGRDAGASLEHPHSQIIVVEAPGPVLGQRSSRAVDYHEHTGRSLVADAFDRWEDSGGSVLELPGVRAVVPHAAEAPFEVWFAATDVECEFGALEKGRMADLAAAVGAVLSAYRDDCGDPPYNLMLHTPGFGRPGGAADQWVLVARTRMSRLAGFELSSGIYINPSSPEADAEYLRSVVRHPAQIGE